MNVTTSVGLTSNSMLAIRRDAATDATRPTTTPISVRRNACTTTRRRTSDRLAPRAILIPSSRVRWFTEYAITP